MTSFPGATIRDISNISVSIFSDAGYLGYNGQPMHAGLGIYMQILGDMPCSQVSISAISPPASWAIEAEAFGLLLAIKLVEMTHIHQATFPADNATSAAAAATQDLLHTPGQREIIPQLDVMVASTSFDASIFFSYINLSRSLSLNAGVTSLSCVRSTRSSL